MSILDFLTGGAGGSMMSGVKQGGQQMGILQMLGLAPDEQYGSPIGAQQGTGAPMPSAMIDPAVTSQNRTSSLANFGNKMSQFGAGMSAASAPSRMPVDFGQVLAGGNQAMQAGDDRNLDNRVKEAQIGALGAKGAPDFDQQAQQVMMKEKMGIPLSPQEQALKATYDAFQNKQQTITMPDGTIRQVPAQRPVFGQVAGDRAAPQGGGQMQRPPLSSFMR